MKKLSVFLLSGLLILPLAACGGTPNAMPPSNDKPPSDRQMNVYEVGDIVLGNGTLIKPEELALINCDNPPIAVIAVLQEDGTALGIGVHISDSCLPWALDDKQGNSPAFAFVDTYAEAHGLDSNAAVEGLGTNWYWASTSSDTEDNYAWFVHYFNGYAACCPTDFDNLHVMAVRVFEGVQQ